MHHKFIFSVLQNVRCSLQSPVYFWPNCRNLSRRFAPTPLVFLRWITLCAPRKLQLYDPAITRTIGVCDECQCGMALSGKIVVYRQHPSSLGRIVLMLRGILEKGIAVKLLRKQPPQVTSFACLLQKLSNNFSADNYLSCLCNIQ